MKLFWREHLPLLGFYGVQMLLVPLVYWLTGEGRPAAIMLYGALLSTALLAMYLAYRYYQHRLMYSRLSEPRAAVRELSEPLGESALPEALYTLMKHYDKHLQEQLQQHKQQSEQHLAFTNRWVHQMKTPISVIQLMLPELEDKAADSIQEELDRLRGGLEMVLYTARLERFDQDFMVTRIDLQAAVKQCIADNRQLLIRRAIQPIIHIPDGLTVSTDTKWLRFILGQIVTNAIKYTDGKGKSIFFTAEVREGSPLLEIRDQGIGIGKEDLRRVFHPYYTGEHGRQFAESTGMGLYLVKEICSRLGHEVALQSERGRGTTVQLRFELAKQTAAVAP